MAESVDALDLGSSAYKHAGSSPAIRINKKKIRYERNRTLTIGFGNQCSTIKLHTQSPPVGIEPTTLWLTAICSATEL